MIRFHSLSVMPNFNLIDYIYTDILHIIIYFMLYMRTRTWKCTWPSSKFLHYAWGLPPDGYYKFKHWKTIRKSIKKYNNLPMTINRFYLTYNWNLLWMKKNFKPCSQNRIFSNFLTSTPISFLYGIPLPLGSKWSLLIVLWVHNICLTPECPILVQGLAKLA